MKLRWIVGVVACLLMAGCAGADIGHGGGGCTGPASFCNVYGNG